MAFYYPADQCQHTIAMPGGSHFQCEQTKGHGTPHSWSGVMDDDDEEQRATTSYRIEWQ